MTGQMIQQLPPRDGDYIEAAADSGTRSPPPLMLALTNSGAMPVDQAGMVLQYIKRQVDKGLSTSFSAIWKSLRSCVTRLSPESDRGGDNSPQ